MRRLPITVSPENAFFKGHDTAAFCRRKIGRSAYESFLSFSVVRNPFDHAISLYTFLNETENQKLRSIVAPMSFDEHLDYRLNRSLLDLAPAFARMPDQSHFICDSSGRILVDRILYFETLDDDIEALFLELGLKRHLLERSRETKGRDRTKSKLLDVQDCFSNDQTVEKVVELYRRDFDLFGYRKNTSDLLSEFRTVPPKRWLC